MFCPLLLQQFPKWFPPDGQDQFHVGDFLPFCLDGLIPIFYSLDSHWKVEKMEMVEKQQQIPNSQTKKNSIFMILDVTGQVMGTKQVFLIMIHTTAKYRVTRKRSTKRLKDTDIDILVTSRNGERKIMQSLRITSRPTSRERKWNQLIQFRWTSTKVTPIEKTWTG